MRKRKDHDTPTSRDFTCLVLREENKKEEKCLDLNKMNDLNKKDKKRIEKYKNKSTSISSFPRVLGLKEKFSTFGEKLFRYCVLKVCEVNKKKKKKRRKEASIYWVSICRKCSQ